LFSSKLVLRDFVSEEEDYLRQGLGHEKLLIKAIKESSDKGHQVKITAYSHLPLSPVSKLSKAGLPCCSYLNNPRSLTHH
jgi:hypothetical protein